MPIFQNLGDAILSVKYGEFIVTLPPGAIISIGDAVDDSKSSANCPPNGNLSVDETTNPISAIDNSQVEDAVDDNDSSANCPQHGEHPVVETDNSISAIRNSQDEDDDGSFEGHYLSVSVSASEFVLIDIVDSLNQAPCASDSTAIKEDCVHVNALIAVPIETSAGAHNPLIRAHINPDVMGGGCYGKNMPSNIQNCEPTEEGIPKNDVDNAHIIDNQHQQSARGLDVNLDGQDHDGNTALHHACLVNNLEITKLLLSRCADNQIQNRDGKNAIHCTSSPDMLDLLGRYGDNLDKKNEKGETPLMIAVKTNNDAVFNHLVTRCNLQLRDNLGYDVLTHAIRSERVEMVKILLGLNHYFF